MRKPSPIRIGNRPIALPIAWLPPGGRIAPIFCEPSCSSRAKQFDEAIGECNQIHDQGSIRLRAATVTGKSQLELGNLAEANRVFSFVVDHQPDNADAHRGLAAVAYEMGHLNRAIGQLEQVVRLDPNDARPHRLLGECYRNSGDTEHALVEYRESLRIGNGLSDTARGEIRFELCEALLLLYRYDEVLALLDEAKTGSSEPPYMRAFRIEAFAGCNGVRKRSPWPMKSSPTNRTGRFIDFEVNFTSMREMHAAVPLLEEAASFSPNHYQTQFLLAQAYAAAGRKSDADRVKARADQIRKDFELAAELAGSN